MYIVRMSTGTLLPGVYPRYDDAKQVAVEWTEKNSPYWASVELYSE